jgi:hypothetical protein
MGLPEKPENIDGGEVEKICRDGRIQDIADYCESLESEDDVDELVSFLKAREAGGVKSVHFFFSTI